MVNRLKPLNVLDFTGGVNLRMEWFQLAENELPTLINLEPDARGGLNTRLGWKATKADRVTTASIWNPRNAYLHVKSDGTTIQMVCHDLGDPGGARVYSSINSAAWSQTVGGTATAKPHGADFTSWADKAWVCRGRGTTFTYEGTTVDNLPASGASNWSNDYTDPGPNDYCPIASLITAHQGFMFVAYTYEDTVEYPNRVRFSHPNNPARWAKDDYIDLNEGGQKITGLISFSDRLLIFKADSVWALFGYDSETWNLVNISRTVGALNQQLVVRSEAAVYFLSWPQGIFAYREGGDVVELSTQIRAIFEDKRLASGAMSNAWMGWVGRRLWVSLPYTTNPQLPPPIDATRVFVFDPTIESWTMFRGAEDCTPGPYIERIEIADTENQLAFARMYPYALSLNATSESAVDECKPNVKVPFETRMRTKWLDAGAPTWKKSWRRPDVLLRGVTLDTTVNAQVFHDYDPNNAQRSFQVIFSPDIRAGEYTANGVDPGFMWGDGTEYSGALQSSSVERGGTMGRAGAVQLLLIGMPGATWGLNGIVFKYVPRRFR